MPYCQGPAGQVSRSGIWAFRGLRKGEGKVGSGKWSTLSARAAHVCPNLFYSHRYLQSLAQAWHLVLSI